MNAAYTRAYAATGNRHYKDVAEKNMQFMLEKFKAEDGSFYHTWKNDKAKYPAFLDDYSNLIAALIELSQVTSNFELLKKARELTAYVKENFEEPDGPFFLFTHKDQKDILIRKKEVYDGATPSGNAVMAYNLYRLSIIFDLPEWKEQAIQMVAGLREVIVKYPTSFGVWLGLLFEIQQATNEIAVTGPDAQKLLEEIEGLYIPHKIIMASNAVLNDFPLLAGKGFNDKNHIYLCKNYECGLPVSTIKDFKALLPTK
jgi:hypothetical protein